VGCACLVADGLAKALELDPADHRAAFLASLVRAMGCGHASENAALFGDDIAFERFLVTFDPGDEAVAGAQLAAIAHALGGVAAARSEIARRAGGHLDLCEVFLADTEEVLAPIEQADDLVDAARATEPAPVLWFSAVGLERPCIALATFADLKGFHLIGHSPHVTAMYDAFGRGDLAGILSSQDVTCSGRRGNPPHRRSPQRQPDRRGRHPSVDLRSGR
jgi:hypothetical protein